MKAIKKKILLASLSISVITPFSEGIVYAEDITVQPTNSSDNTVEINDSNYTINGTTKKKNSYFDDNYKIIYGGYSSSENVKNNHLTFNGGNAYYNGFLMYGGYSLSGMTIGNILNVIGDTIHNNVYGGYSGTNALENTVNIGGANTAYPHYGSNIYGGYSTSGKAEGNVVNINGGMPSNTYVVVYGGYSESSESIGNKVNVTGNNAVPTISGGHSEADATGNIVTIDNGGAWEVYGGVSSNGNVVGNIVNINDGNIGRAIYGGYAYNGNATGNKVNITGGNFNGTTDLPTLIWAGHGKNEATNNEINIYGNPDLTYTWIEGGSALTASGNTLNIYTKDLKAINIAAFQNVNFYIPVGTVNGDTMLTLTDTNGTYLSDVAINAGIQAGNNTLKNGDVVNLLTNDNGIITYGTTTYGKLTEGVSLTYDLAVSQQGNSIVAQIGNPINNNPINNNPINNNLVNNQNLVPLIQNQDFTKYTNPETKILTVSQPISFVLPEIPNIPDNIVDTFPEFDLNSDYTDNNINDSNNNSNDNNDKDEIRTSDDKDKSEEEKNKNVGSTDSPTHKGWEIFGDMGGGSLKHKTGGGGYIDTKMQNIDLGFARSLGNGLNKMTIAPIIDYQKSNFDSYVPDGVNIDGSTRHVHGTGTTKYTGGGFILRNMNHNGFYYEGSLRVGKSKTDFASDNLDTTGFFGRVTYDSSATIVNGHIKIGKHLRVSPNSLIDIYGFYYHTHQGGSSANLSSGEHYDFSSANSGRLRIGYRWTTRTSKISKVYTGLAFQYEHNTGVTGSYKDYKTPDTGSSGSSGMLEFGWLIKPLKNNPWAVDINATGWVGYQRGITAMAKISKAF